VADSQRVVRPRGKAQRVTVERDAHGLVYITLQPAQDRKAVVAFSIPLRHGVVVDYMPDGSIFGVEVETR